MSLPNFACKCRGCELARKIERLRNLLDQIQAEEKNVLAELEHTAAELIAVPPLLTGDAA